MSMESDKGEKFPHLSERHLAILQTVVSQHIATGGLVASKTIAHQLDLSLSPATVRHVMADLEAMGLLHQPHTSAGRLPTDRGYRCYIASLQKNKTLTEERQQIIHEACERGGEDIVQVLVEVSKAMALLTNYLGIALSPRLENEIFQQIQFVILQDGRVLAILVHISGRVQHRVFHLEESLGQRELDEIACNLSKRFKGLSLAEARFALVEEVNLEWHEYELMREKILAQFFCHQGHGSSLIINGQPNLFRFPELSSDAQKIRELLKTIEEKEQLVKMLDQCLESSEVRLFVGNETPGVSGCSLVAAKYFTSDKGYFGTLGVLGPMRLDYGLVIPLVDFSARVISRAFSR